MSWFSSFITFVGSLFGGVESEVQLVLTELKPVFQSFVKTSATLVEQVGKQAYSDMVVQAKVIAAQVAADPAMAGKTGVQKFEAFAALLLTWAKTYAPTLVPVLEAGIGPALRVALEMAIGAVLTAS